MVAFVTPKSSKAKNRFHNLMECNPWCVVEQRKEGSIFLVSENGRQTWWHDLSSDEWDVVIDCNNCI